MTIQNIGIAVFVVALVGFLIWVRREHKRQLEAEKARADEDAQAEKTAGGAGGPSPTR